MKNPIRTSFPLIINPFVNKKCKVRWLKITFSQFWNYFGYLGQLIEQNFTGVLQEVQLLKNCPPLLYIHHHHHGCRPCMFGPRLRVHLNLPGGGQDGHGVENLYFQYQNIISLPGVISRHKPTMFQWKIKLSFKQNILVNIGITIKLNCNKWTDSRSCPGKLSKITATRFSEYKNPLLYYSV